MIQTVAEAVAANTKIFLAESARLSKLYTKYIVARDRTRSYVLVGGLGISGSEQIWAEEAFGVHGSMPGFADAPERSSYCGPGTPEHAKLSKQVFDSLGIR